MGYLVSSDTFGGAEFYVAQLLARLPPDLEAVLFGVGPLPDRLYEAAHRAGVEVVAAPGVARKLDLRRLWTLRRTLRRARLDVAHVNATMATNNRWALAAAVASGLPVVVTLHLRHEIPLRAQRVLLRRAYSRVAAAVAVSQEVAEQLTGHLAVPSERVRLIANGVDVRDADEQESRPRGATTPPGGDERTVRIGAVGRLQSQKGFDLLIEATARLVGAGCRVEVVIGGEGPEEAILRGRARALDVPVTFAGHVEVAPFLAGIDVFCLPSRWEGLPFVLLEAMMSGRPCVATAVGDVVGAVGDTALVVPPGDVVALAGALERLVRDPVERRDLGRAAARRAREHHSSERMVAETVGVYREVAAG